MSTRHLSWSARVPIGYAGNVPVLPSTEWLKYYEQGRDRMGGNEALTNIELEELSDARFETLTYLALAPEPKRNTSAIASNQWRYVSVTTSVSASVGDFVDVDASGAAVTVTLPNVAASKGRIVGVSKVDSSANLVTISGTVNGQSSIMITRQYTSLVMLSTGAEWRLI